MFVNEFDKQISSLFPNSGEADQELQKFKSLLEELCSDLKQVWHKKGFTDSLIRELIDDCLELATRSIEEHEWDEMKADNLNTLLVMGDTDKRFRNVMSRADRSRDLEIQLLLKKLEVEKRMFFINDSIEHLEGMAYRLLSWLNVRSALVNTFDDR
ncbi:hypothetical protein [Metabacillus fastidiosus]|uniref:hypothetical protein n=1 Tax=Metabacillus fastidiosus TaxID=1458 RepID=UPI003D28FB1B